MNRRQAVNALLLAMASMGIGCPGRRERAEAAPAEEEQKMVRKVMVSPLAGQWFPADERALRNEIAQLSRGIDAVRKSGMAAIVAPHAGYRFSGAVAAGVYLRVDPRGLRRIVVMGPSHHVAMPNRLSVPDATHFRTPLGELAVDLEFVSRLRALPFVIHEPRAHDREHSDQIQLPMIQALLTTDLPVVCVISGQFDPAHLVEAAAALRGLLDESTLLVISTDFTHYGEQFGYVPFAQDIQKNIEALDMGAFELFARKDLAGFLRYLDQTGATVCGRDPLAFLLAMMPVDAQIQKTGYETSGRLLKDDRHSVSYLGALIRGSWAQPAARAPALDASGARLSPEDGDRLVAWARETIARAFQMGRAQAAAFEPANLTPGMREIRGGFVTLHQQGALRGCIGEIAPRRELWQVVREHALNAAFNDARFPPVRADELDALDIELSALTPPRPVSSWREIEVGRHGIVLTQAGRSAVFLPQVAQEQGWGIEETLAQLSRKAGLPADAWRGAGASFMVFEAQIAREKRGQRR